MDNLLQKKTWSRRPVSSLIPGKEVAVGASRPPYNRVRGGAGSNARSEAADCGSAVTVSQAPGQVSLELVQSNTVETSTTSTAVASEIDVRSLPSRKVIVTGKLSGRPIDLVATLLNDGSLQVKGFNGTLPTELTSRQTPDQGVHIGGRRDGVRIEADLSLRPEGRVAVTEQRGNDVISLAESVAEGQNRLIDRLTLGLPRDMVSLFRATMLYLMMRCAS